MSLNDPTTLHYRGSVAPRRTNNRHSTIVSISQVPSRSDGAPYNRTFKRESTYATPKRQENKQSVGGRPDRLPVAYIASRQSDLTLALQTQQHSANDEQQPARRLRDGVGRVSSLPKATSSQARRNGETATIDVLTKVTICSWIRSFSISQLYEEIIFRTGASVWRHYCILKLICIFSSISYRSGCSAVESYSI